MKTSLWTVLGLAITAIPAAAQAQSASEKAFVADALAGDVAEVQMGQLVAQKASSPDVKSYGQMLADDHGKALDEMKTLADNLGVQVPSQPKPDAQKEMDKLSKLDGQAFDREFLKHAVADHKKDIAKFRKESRGKGDVANTAKQQLPVLETHLQRAQELMKQDKGARG
jgi:putative membrane protein